MIILCQCWRKFITTMDKTEHQNLSNTIREVHEKLRKSFHLTQDLNKVWQEHIKEEDLRKKYSQAMMKLATEIWVGKDCRIEWSYRACMNFFYHGGLEKFLAREKKIKELSIIKGKETPGISDDTRQNNFDFSTKRQLKLLDIGSCYNPFSKFSEFSCVAIDLTPATKDVLPCDFLQAEIHMKSNAEVINDSKLTFFEESFDIVVMSLVLEYLPAAEQRAIFCFKAWQLLQLYGLCIIITPDSKSLHHNAPMMKSWKTAFEKIGFKRVKYEKLTHLHCMAFCKMYMTSSVDISSCKSLSDLLYIPQDFKCYADDDLPIERSEEECQSLYEQFSELPNEV
ncbi:S-adenosylmethionine sensor upstream of mTORC1-like isoform X2 [Argiope bruennichi]|uniref:S-adenosylmethionine sensor upstream of mTORC1-like isoform X2 n=1 Tax=Argiope bruennichi TaxID=94029 RepID=UPI0024942951|nr:S-adenosylmethionine sensor upstream of mTORC1-like isoform X2 [Argiope bruennichi]